MFPTFRTRHAAQLALTANALRPLRGSWLSLPAFASGWLTAELAPQLLALTAADAAAHIARRGKTDRAGLVLAGLSAAGLAALATSAQRARYEVEAALTESLGDDYLDTLPTPPLPADLATPWRQLVMPFRMRDPEVRRTRDLAYAPGGRRFTLDIYEPRTPDASEGERPVLLQVHGGGWVVGSKNDQGVPLMLHMARRGWVCVSVNYPLSPKASWPEHIVAVKRALAWIRGNIAEHGGDPSFVAATGGSAGGHLSALLALTPNDPVWQPGFEDADTSVQACVPFYGAYDFAAQTESKAAKIMQRAVLERYVVRQDPRRYRDVYVAASPLSRITDAAPPFFVIHGKHDSLIPVADAREFVRRLRAISNQPVAYAEISGAQHAFDIFPSIRSAHVVRGVRRFLEWTYARRASAGELPAAAEG